MRRPAATTAWLALLAACSSPDQPDQLSADEDARLNRAAEMLDANSIALDDSGDNLSEPLENDR